MAGLGALSLAACGGLSDVGDQKTVPPQAVATVIQAPFTSNSDGSATATVRAQSQILLSAKDSIDGSAPITQFTFTQTDSNAKVPLIIRTTNTVALNIPAVQHDTTYTFQLKVGDSQGGTDTTTATFNVKAVLDPDQFLQYLNAKKTYQIVVAPSAAVAASAAATSGDYKVTIKRLLTYTDRTGLSHVDVPLEPVPAPSNPNNAPFPSPLQISGTWSSTTGASANCNVSAAQNEGRVFTLEIPSVNQDDINFVTQTTDRTQELALGDINSGSLKLDVSVTQSAPAGPTPQVCVLDVSNAVFAGPTQDGMVETADLRGAADVTQDTAASTAAYYTAVDSAGADRSTFFKWLAANGFTRTATNYGADAHALYTNNFDLGFGRDMYTKINCHGAAVATGNCDVASVVVNYPSMDSAAKKLNAINAVAMEYTGGGARGAQRIVKFYAFAPNFRTDDGDFTRIQSVDLDGRGERFLPGACTVCHGGAPGGVTGNGTYQNGGDVNSGFLPWDLDALLFSDTDTSFSKDPADAQLKANFTRAKQEGELRKLSAAAYITYDDTPTAPGRFALARELVAGWYSVATAPAQSLDQVLSGTHNGAFTPEGWASTANGNPSDSADVYQRVFAQNCRMCHVMQVPNPSLGDIRQSQLCSSSGSATAVGVPQQDPMGCYWQFAHTQNLALRLSAGQMPLARVTMDRFWVLPRSGGQTAAAVLTAHLARQDTIAQTVTVPGAPTGTIASSPQALDVGTSVNLAVTNGSFINTVAWTVKRCAQASDTSTCTTDVAVTAAAGNSASFTVNAVSAYLVQLYANGGTTPIASQVLIVTDTHPVLASATPSFTLGTSYDVSSLVTGYGNGGRSHATLSISGLPSNLQVSNTQCQTSCPASTDLTLTTTSQTAVSGTFTLSVQDANDAQPVSQTYSVSATSSITARALTLCTLANSQASALSSSCQGTTITPTTSSIDLLALNNSAYASRSDLAVVLVPNAQTQTTTLMNSANVRGTAQLAASRNLSYTPPPRVSTASPNGQLPNSQTYDQILYHIVRSQGGAVVETTPNQTLSIQVRENHSFADVISFFASGTSPACTSCHNSTNASSTEPDYSVAGDANSPGSTRTAADVYAIFSPIGSAFLNDAPATAHPFVALPPATVTSSGLYCFPLTTADSNSCSGGNHPAAFTDSQLAVLKTWLNDGGNNF